MSQHTAITRECKNIFLYRPEIEKIFLIDLYYTFKFSFLINDSASQREFIGHLDRELSFR